MTTGKIWKLTPDSGISRDLAKELNITGYTARLLVNRGISDIASAKSFLAPSLSDLSDPMLLADMDRALDLIIRAVTNREKIVVYGDYDADGLTASALLLIFFTELGIPVSAYIPNRLTEGYGLNAGAVENIAGDGGELIITVDCGISSRNEIELAHDLGLKIIITDHHQVPEDFVPLCPVINPHRADSSFPYKDLAGAGVAFFLLIGVRAALRDAGWFMENREPDLRHYLDLAALGTVGDMTPLTGLNRILVASGIEVMKKSKWPGIKAIQDISGIQASCLSASDIAFRIAPRLNAPGRMGDSKTGLETLTAKTMSYAMEKADLLNSLNSRRQVIESDILSEIEDILIPGLDIEKMRSLVLYKEGWHQGVLGIVASKLLDKYRRPAIVLCIKNGMATGSGRSIDGFNLYKAIEEQGCLVEKFGGHYHAAGLTLKAANLDNFITGIEDLAGQVLKDQDLVPVLNIDGEIDLHDLTKKLMAEIQTLAPFGSGNPDPLFLIRSARVLNSRIAGERHLKLTLRQDNNIIYAIGFGLADMHSLEGELVDVVFTPEMNLWNGHEKIQMRIVDIEITGKNKKLQQPPRDPNPTPEF